MKFVKRISIALGGVLIVLLASAFIIPILFKDNIKAAIDKAIAKNVNADVIFDVNNFSLSVFRHFPNVTAEMKNLGVFNRAPFAGEHLFVVDQLDVEVNLFDVIFGKQLRIKGITLIRPQVNISVLKDGTANYNITYPSKDSASTVDEPSKFSIGIDHWEIVNGDVTYDDKSLLAYLKIQGLNHTGSGDFTQSVFDLKTQTIADTVTTSYGTMELLTQKRVEINSTLSISEDITKFTLKENIVKVNDFGLAFDGWFKMNEKDYGMDISFKSPENSFKSLLSIVPGMFTKDFKKIETKGDLLFRGFVKGTYSDKQLPAFNVDLAVKEAMFKYPDLPTAVSNINMNLLLDNKDGIIEHTLVDLKKLHLEFGANPVDARFTVYNLKDYKLDGNLKAKLNLAELSKMFPMPGIEVSGIYSIDASANGIYDSLKKIIPAINAQMSLRNGYAKSSKLPVPLESMNLQATVKNTSGKMAETKIAVDNFSMMLDGEKLEARMSLEDLNDYTWNVHANGGIDLEKITKIFPVEGMSLSGKIKAVIETKGRMSDVNAKRYDQLPTSGKFSLQDFKFSSKTTPYKVGISVAEATFDPRKIELQQMNGTIGNSDFKVKGAVSNYIAYVLKNETITAVVNFNATLFDLNQFMSSSNGQPAANDTTSLSVLPIPKNIDFALNCSIQTVKMMDFAMTEATGQIIIKNGIANLNGLKFNLLSGFVGMNGSYNALDIKHPKYDMGFKIDHMSIQQAASTFSIIKTYAPFAGVMSGSFSADMKLSGDLKNNMTPQLPTLNGTGMIKIADGTVSQSKLISAITSLTKLPDTDKILLKDLAVSVTIVNGKLMVKPFDIKIGGYTANIGGNTGLDGSLDYLMKMNVPAGALGAQYQSFINQYAGAKNSSSTIPVTIGIGGTYSNLKTSLKMDQQKQQAQEAVTNAGKEALQNAVKGTKVEDAVNSLLGNKKSDTTKIKDTTKNVKPASSVNQLLQNKLQNLLKKKKP